MITYLLALLILIVSAELGFNIYMFIRNRSLSRHRFQQNEPAIDIGFGELQQDGHQIVHLMNEGTSHFANVSFLVSGFQNKLQRFCLNQSQETRTIHQSWISSLNFLIEIDEQIRNHGELLDSDVLISGIRRRIDSGFEDAGIRRIVPEPGQQFAGTNYKCYEERHDDLDHGMILETVRAGYEIRTNGEAIVLRPAEVIVSLGPKPAPKIDLPCEESSDETSPSAENFDPEIEASGEKSAAEGNISVEQPCVGSTSDESLEDEPAEQNHNHTLEGADHETDNRS
jgi:hypothetical protein